jgi:hypothetical protein
MKMIRLQGEDAPVWLRRSIAGLLAGYVLVSLYLLWRTAVLAPFSDELNWALRWYQLQADHRWAAYLLDPHNINRLLWTRLAVALDMGALGGTNAPLILSGAIALAAMAAVLATEAARAAPQPLKLAVGALAAMLTLMAGNVLDASTPIYVTYTHAAIFAVLAIVLSEGAPRSPIGWRRVGALACAAASAFGSGAGLALWPVMAWGAFRRRDWTWLAVVLVFGAAFVSFYLDGQAHGAGAATLPALHDPRSAAILALSFVTLPWTRVVLDHAWIGGALFATAAVAIILVKGGPKATPSERIACGLMLFTLGAAAMAGLGRSGYEDPHNVPLRYSLLVAPLQVGLLMLAAPYIGAFWRERRRLTQNLVLAVLVLVFAQNAVMAVKVVQASDLIRNLVVDFHDGLRTPRMLTIINPDLDAAQAISDRLTHDGYFQHELHLKPPAPAR